MRVYFGPPGTGKTRTLIEDARRELKSGVRPDRIAFLAFSRRAAHEARGRGRNELELDEDSLRWWSTLHSAAARQSGVGGGDLMGEDHWRELGDLLNLGLVPPDEDGRPVFSELDRRAAGIQHVYSLSRAMMVSPPEAWESLGRPVDRELLEHFARNLERYKEARSVMDYPDLLDTAPGDLPVDVAFIDEAQDLTPAQWEYALRAVRGARRVYVAGDDDQAVYQWAGADVRRFLSLEGERVVLDRSFRLPRSVYQVAAGILDRIALRQPKEWSPRDDEGTVIRGVSREDHVPVDRGWLLLARTRAAARRWESRCRSDGLTYEIDGESSVRPGEARAIRIWETARRGQRVEGSELAAALSMAGRSADLDPAGWYNMEDVGIPGAPIWHEALKRIPPARRRYYESCLRRDNRALAREPAAVISTIHGAKGAEADHVAVLADTSPRITEGALRDPDAEHRVWYVAATRARESLYLVQAAGVHYYRV